jgi:sulfate permease, SulP family
MWRHLIEKKSLMTHSIRYGLHHLKTTFRFDIVAGLTVAMIAVPQAMAFASIVGVNPIYGLYTAIIPAMIGGIFGSSNHLVTGPTNTVSLTASGVLILLISQANYQEYVFALAIISGAMMLVLGLLRLGSLARYVSNAVLTGFLTGAAILIILNQVSNFLGLPGPANHATIEVVSYLVTNIGEINFLVFAVGISNFALLAGGRRLWSHFPIAMVVLLLTGALAHYFRWTSFGLPTLASLSDLNQINFSFHVPDIPITGETIQLLIVGSGAVVLVSMVAAISVSKAIGQQTGQHINPSKEFIAQGLASLVGGFFQTMPSSVSLARSAVNFNSGAVTRLSGTISGLFVLVVVLLFKNWVGYIAVVSLSAIVIISALQLINLDHIRLTWRSQRSSKVVFTVTFLAVLFFPIQIAIYLGTLLSIGFYLSESSHLPLHYLELDETTDKFVELDLKELPERRSKVVIVNIEGALYFAAVEGLEDRVNYLIDSGVEVIILRMRRANMIASTAITSLEGLIQRASNHHVKIILTGVSEETRALLMKGDINHYIHEEDIFNATSIPYEATRKALNHAKLENGI